MTTRVQVRRSVYRGEPGHLVTGRDTRGRRVKVFTPGDSARVKFNIMAGLPAFDREERQS